MNLLLVEPHEPDGAGMVALTGARAAHLLRVLKVTPGQQLRVGIVNGPRGIGVVKAAGEGRVELACAFEHAVPPRPRADLLLALPRPKVLRRLWAQIAALGVGRIILTNAERVERDYFDTHILAPAAYRPLLVEGLQQARDTRLPEVTVHRRFKVLVEDELAALCADALRIVADPSAADMVQSVVSARSGARVLLAVGPEGGWNAFELSLLERHGFRRAGMGPRPLRTDTACVALLALIHAALERPLHGQA